MAGKTDGGGTSRSAPGRTGGGGSARPSLTGAGGRAKTGSTGNKPAGKGAAPADGKKKGVVKSAVGGAAAGASGKSAAGKAAGGGVTGALAGAAEALGKNGHTKKLVMASLFASPPVLLAVVMFVMVGMLATITGGSQGVDSYAQNTAQQAAGLSDGDVGVYIEAAESTSVPWELLAALASVQKGNSQGGSASYGGLTGFSGDSICPANSPTDQPMPAPNPNPPTSGPAAGYSIPGPYICASGAKPLPAAMIAAIATPGTTGATSAAPTFSNAGPVLTLVPSAAPTSSAAASPTPSAGATTPAADGQYMGPYKIARDSGIEEEQAKDLYESAEFIGKRIRGVVAAKADEPGGDKRAADGFGDGALFSSDVDANAIDKDGAVYKLVRSAYAGAIAGLPIKGASTSRGELAFDLAMQWHIGKGNAAGSTNGGSSGTGMVCDPTPGTVGTVDGPTGPMTLDEKQLGYAAVIVATAKTAIPGTDGETAAVIAIMAALQESGLRMYANEKVAESLTYPHDAVGRDGLSVGLFQQQAGFGWGTVQQDMDAQFSTLAFLGLAEGVNKGVTRIAGWQTMGKGKVVQTVQVSAFPDAYDKWEKTAGQIVGKVIGIACTGLSSTIDTAGGTTAPPAATGAAGADPAASVIFSSDAAKKIIGAAASMIGMQYVFAAGNYDGASTGSNEPIAPAGTVGFDCSGLVLFAYAQAGIRMPGHYTVTQAGYVKDAGNWKTAVGDLVPGDMIFFTGGDGSFAAPGHVGIYLGDNLMVNAPSSGNPVSVDDVGPGSYWSSSFVGGGHV